MLSSFNLLLVALSIFDSCYVVGAFMESLRYVRGAHGYPFTAEKRSLKMCENIEIPTTFVYTLFTNIFINWLVLRLIFAVVKRSQNFTCFKPPYSTRNVFSFQNELQRCNNHPHPPVPISSLPRTKLCHDRIDLYDRCHHFREVRFFFNLTLIRHS